MGWKAQPYRLVRRAGSIRSEMAEGESQLGTDFDGSDSREGIGALGELDIFVATYPGTPRFSVVLEEFLRPRQRFDPRPFVFRCNARVHPKTRFSTTGAARGLLT